MIIYLGNMTINLNSNRNKKVYSVNNYETL